MIDLAALTLCVDKFCVDSAKLHEIMTKSATESITITLDDGSTRILPSIAKAINDIGDTNLFLLKDLTNALADSLKRLGLDGYDASTKMHNSYDGNLQDIAINSLYSYDDLSDAPQNGKGLVATMVIDADNIIQICRTLEQSPKTFIKCKIAGVWSSSWKNSGLDQTDLNVIIALKKLNTKGDLLYKGDADLEKLAIGNENQILQISNNVPTWQNNLKNENSLSGGIDKVVNVKGAYACTASCLMDDGSIRAAGKNTGGIDIPYILSNFVRPLFNRDKTQKIIDIFSSPANKNYSIFEDGSVCGWGKNTDGDLGTSKDDDADFPENITNVANITDIYPDWGTTMFLASDGKLWISGDNQFGSLGDGTTTSSNEPVLLTKQDWKKIYSANKKMFAIDDSDNLYEWGQDATGSPIQLITNVDKIVVSEPSINSPNPFLRTILALKKDGTVWGWGMNTAAELGLSHTNNVISPTELTALGSDNTDILSIGHYDRASSLVIKNDGTIWGSGYNATGVLGLGNNTSVNVFTKSTSSDRTAKAKKIISLGYNLYNSSDAQTTNHTGCAALYDDGKVFVAGELKFYPDDKTIFQEIKSSIALPTITDIYSIGYIDANNLHKVGFLLKIGNFIFRMGIDFGQSGYGLQQLNIF